MGENNNYHIYSNKRPGGPLFKIKKFWTFKRGAYSRGAIIRGRALIKFSLFQSQKHSNLEQICWHLPLHHNVQHDDTVQ